MQHEHPLPRQYLSHTIIEILFVCSIISFSFFGRYRHFLDSGHGFPPAAPISLFTPLFMLSIHFLNTQAVHWCATQCNVYFQPLFSSPNAMYLSHHSILPRPPVLALRSHSVFCSQEKFLLRRGSRRRPYGRGQWVASLTKSSVATS